MSKFSIYKSDHSNPEVSRRRSNMVAVALVLLIPVSIVLINHLVTWQYKDYLSIPVFIVYGCLYYWNYIKARNLKQIGEILITVDGIEKSVGNLQSAISFESLQKVEVKKFYPGVFGTGSRDGYHSLILSLEYHNKNVEKLIISDKSINDPSHSALDNLKYLQKKQLINLIIR